MQRFLRPFTGLFLALILGFTAQSMAVARGMSQPVDEIILCTGNGPVMMAVDENGNPTGPAHICPEFTLSVFQVGAAITAPLPRRYWVRINLVVSGAVDRAGHSAPQPQARGPPARV
ncbi:hypothetical protein Q4577_01705 [Marinovum sp. 2_MG-2023]|uniref:hypothetical protein n=1 Tax=unclassified Marinovum TaxID=2647166 RepID=UPI0026E17969|nr:MULTISPECIES: hypothetical protein [unclassified Marinovum]MDO6728714.1 hypothetical protein [Marinovum sp. 2_MG-2023]MDO6777870.1 hypothetical protein [Marinovum sp. 1_MG-2023]